MIEPTTNYPQKAAFRLQKTAPAPHPTSVLLKDGLGLGLAARTA